jgi:hypothetical protein
VLKVAGDAMFDAVAASRVDLVALSHGVSVDPPYSDRYKEAESGKRKAESPKLTLILRALQRRQPLLDFLWERRGGILLVCAQCVAADLGPEVASSSGLVRVGCGLWAVGCGGGLVVVLPTTVRRSLPALAACRFPC